MDLDVASIMKRVGVSNEVAIDIARLGLSLIYEMDTPLARELRQHIESFEGECREIVAVVAGFTVPGICKEREDPICNKFRELYEIAVRSHSPSTLAGYMLKAASIGRKLRKAYEKCQKEREKKKK